MYAKFVFLSALFAFVGVAMGAFGAHGLKNVLSADSMHVYQTAVHYQLWHALGIGLIAIFIQQNPGAHLLLWAGWFMVAGIVLFSGSLYILSINDTRWLGIVTPIGGLAFLIAWVLLGLSALKFH